MAWLPSVAAVDVRSVAPNVKTFFDAHVEELRAWAGLNAGTAWTFYPTAESRVKTDFPHTGIVRRRVAVDSKGDGHHVTLEFTFETEVATEHTKEGRTATLALLQYESDSHALALESLLLNIPTEDLYADVPRRRGDFRRVTTGDPLEVAVGETKSVFNVQQQFVMQFIVGHRG